VTDHIPDDWKPGTILTLTLQVFIVLCDTPHTKKQPGIP
jgi:hypothetical protein